MRPRVLRLFTPLPPRVFFFSSRRRHTRYIGDWSSDVCSSDLLQPTALQEALVEGEHEPGRRPEERCEEIGRASCRERVWSWVGAVSFKKNNKVRNQAIRMIYD